MLQKNITKKIHLNRRNPQKWTRNEAEARPKNAFIKNGKTEKIARENATGWCRVWVKGDGLVHNSNAHTSKIKNAIE